MGPSTVCEQGNPEACLFLALCQTHGAFSWYTPTLTTAQ